MPKCRNYGQTCYKIVGCNLGTSLKEKILRYVKHFCINNMRTMFASSTVALETPNHETVALETYKFKLMQNIQSHQA